MKTLVLNCGSSSVKFQLIEMDNEEVLAKGVVEKIGSSEAILNYQPEGKNKIVQTREIINHDVAISLVLRTDRKSTRLNSSHTDISRMPSSA